MQTVPIVVSVLALIVSIITAWLTLFHHGTVRMTQPTVVYFGPDGSLPDSQLSSPKIFFRTLLYSTSKRGQIIESMFVKVRRGETSQTFNIWVYGDDRLLRGSGLFVGEAGVASNHHFLLSSDGTVFQFLSGSYTLDVFAKLVNSSRTINLSAVDLHLSDQTATILGQNGDAGVYFDWGSDSQTYKEHVRERPKISLPRFLLAPTELPKKRTRKRSGGL